MTSDLHENPVDPEKFTVESLTRQTLEAVPSQLAEMLLLGALPHWLDKDVLSILFSDHGDLGAVLAEIQRFRFVMQAAPDQLVYQRQVREYILETWLQDRPDRFRQISTRLADYYYSRAVSVEGSSKLFLPEYIYHLLAANPSEGIVQLGYLFEQSIDAYEIGFAERLTAITEERRPLLENQIAWIEYYGARLLIAQYNRESAIDVLRRIAYRVGDPLLNATAQRALGQGLVQNKQWSEGIRELQLSLSAFNHLHNDQAVTRTLLSLGDAYRDLAENSGGVYEERIAFTGWFHFVVYVVANLPFLIYRKLARRIDAIPVLYGANYQNWIVIRLLRLASQTYQESERTSANLNDERLGVEIQQRLADTEFELGYYHKAEKRYYTLLETPLVRSSPYRNACVHLGLARLGLLKNERMFTRQHLNESLEVFIQMGDWHLAGEAAYRLGRLSEGEHRLASAVDDYTTAITATTRARDGIRRTEIVSALKHLIISSDFLSLEEEQRKRAMSALDTVDTQIYVARFPGQIQRWFTRISWMLGGPVLFVVALSLAILSGVTLVIAEGSIRNLISQSPVPLGLTNSIIVILTALVPFYALWIRHLLYVLIGLFVVRFLLPITSIEKSKPQMYILSDLGIGRSDGSENPSQIISWREVDALVIADRFAWQNPNPLLSRTLVIDRRQHLTIRGTTHNYQDLQQAIETYRLRNDPDAHLAIHCSIAIFKHWWLWTTLVLAGILAAGLVFNFGVYSQYCATLYINGVCPNPINLVAAPWAMWTNILFVLLFSIGTVIRLANAEFCVRRTINQIRRSQQKTTPR